MENKGIKTLYAIENVMISFSIVFIISVCLILRSWFSSPNSQNTTQLIFGGILIIICGGIELGWIILLLIYRKEYLHYRKVQKRFKELKKIKARRAKFIKLLHKCRIKEEKLSKKTNEGDWFRSPFLLW